MTSAELRLERTDGMELGAQRAFRLLVAAIVLLSLANAAILAIRIGSIAQHYELFETSGMEPLRVYGIWKLLHGHPLYEWPAFPYTVHLYNFLFYGSYAAVLALLGTDGPEILLHGKWITLAFGLAGVWICQRLILKLADVRGLPGARAISALLAFNLLLGSAFTSWWALSIRPDIPSLVLALGGLALFLSGLDDPRRRWMWAASCLFFMAWAFKQSSVFIYAGVLAFALLRQRRALAPLQLPVVAGIALALWLGGELYRMNILVAPSYLAVPLLPALAQGVQELWTAVVVNPFSWFYAPLIAGAHLLSRRRGEADAESNPAWRYTLLGVLLFGATVASGVYSSGAAGASRNHIYEGYAVAGVLSGALLLRCAARGQSAAVLLGAGLVVLSVVPPTLQLALPNRFGRTFVATPQEIATKQQLAASIASLPKPLFYERKGLLFALPWNASDGQYPAFLIDQFIYFPSVDAGRLRGPGYGALIRERYFGSLILPEASRFRDEALAGGYREMPRPPGLEEGFSLFVRDTGAASGVAAGGS